MTPDWTIGVEIELLAPRGASRLDLATRIAALRQGTVRRFLHPQSEPSKVAGKPTFENLTPGFEARDAAGQPLARFVDDVTLQHGLDRRAPPRPGWHRIVTDDGRLLRLVMRQCDPAAPLETVLQPLAALFGTRADLHAAGMVRVSDDQGASIAIAAPLPGERERTCEIVTPPLATGQLAALDFLLATARAAGFTLPREGATHIHFDATRLASAAVFARLVPLLATHGAALKRLVGTNPHCIRLGPWPDPLLALVAQPGFAAQDWPTARKALAGLGLQKYCDFNLLNILRDDPAKHTFEVRVLPSSLDAAAIIAAAELFAAILHWCVAPPDAPCSVPATPDDLLAAVPLAPSARARWRGAWAAIAAAQPGG